MFIIMSDDRETHLLHFHGPDFYFALCEIDEQLRQKIKYENYCELQPARDLLHEILRDRGLSLDMVS